MSTPQETNKAPEKKPRQGIPIERILIVLSIFGGILLILFGGRTLTERVKLDTVPMAGEWQAQRQPWHMELKPDKTILSYNGPSQASASKPEAPGKGTYKVDYFGTLWVTLDDGKVFKSTLNPEMPNRFDLIQMDTEGVTVFERVGQPTPNGPQAPK